MNQQIWPGWETVRVIGSGGFGKVYEIQKSEDSKTGDYRSALKVITIPQSSDDYRAYEDDGYDEKSISAIFKEQIYDIVSEFQMMSQFKGTSNIVSYEDHRIVTHADGRGWDILIRMELLMTLPEYFNQHGMSEADTIKLGKDICKALELCGQKKIVHRDIKPQNIFVNEFGDFKLGDFGIAKFMDHTTRAAKIGTYGYMAPEVYRDMPYHASVDIYSLGLVMYWLLNERRLPFLPMPPAAPTAEQNNEAQGRRLSGEAIPAPKNGSPELKAVVLKALSFEPAERFHSPKEFSEALHSCERAEENAYASTYTRSEDTIEQDTWARIPNPGGRNADPWESQPTGDYTQGIWNDTSTADQWTQHDPWEEQKNAQKSKKASCAGDRHYSQGRSYKANHYDDNSWEDELELFGAEAEKLFASVETSSPGAIAARIKRARFSIRAWAIWMSIWIFVPLNYLFADFFDPSLSLEDIVSVIPMSLFGIIPFISAVKRGLRGTDGSPLVRKTARNCVRNVLLFEAIMSLLARLIFLFNVNQR